MAIAWSALKLVMTFLIAKTSGQCPADSIVIGPSPSGKVEVGSDGAEYVLLDEFDRLGIHFLAGCSGQQSEVVLRLANGTDWFTLEQDPVRVDSKTLQLKPDVGYDKLLALPQHTIIAVEVKGVPYDKSLSIQYFIWILTPPLAARLIVHFHLFMPFLIYISKSIFKIDIIEEQFELLPLIQIFRLAVPPLKIAKPTACKKLLSRLTSSMCTPHSSTDSLAKEASTSVLAPGRELVKSKLFWKIK